MEDTKAAPITTSAQEVQTISVVGDNYSILVSGDQTVGRVLIRMLISMKPFM